MKGRPVAMGGASRPRNLPPDPNDYPVGSTLRYNSPFAQASQDELGKRKQKHDENDDPT